MSPGMRGINLAGPRAARCCNAHRVDLSEAPFPYLAVREGEVAGVPVRVLRVGFVGAGLRDPRAVASGARLWER